MDIQALEDKITQTKFALDQLRTDMAAQTASAAGVPLKMQLTEASLLGQLTAYEAMCQAAKADAKEHVWSFGRLVVHRSSESAIAERIQEGIAKHAKHGWEVVGMLEVTSGVFVFLRKRGEGHVLTSDAWDYAKVPSR